MYPSMTRRQFTRLLAFVLLMGGSPGAARSVANAGPSASAAGSRKMKVAAMQMAPRPVDVAANLEQAERLARQAIGEGAEWIMLPEIFTSAAAFHPDML